LENAGRNAGLRYATREQLLQAMQGEQLESAYTDALLQPQRMLIDGLLGVRETMYCENRAVTPKKAPAKKTPAKAPPKKAPAKKPAKKAPGKGNSKR
ncbi:MAG TPA: hypothetical protein VFN13_03140, partial [Rudaea sp.]|nr:hypothetical protein [Rudaea sp.]